MKKKISLLILLFLFIPVVNANTLEFGFFQFYLEGLTTSVDSGTYDFSYGITITDNTTKQLNNGSSATYRLDVSYDGSSQGDGNIYVTPVADYGRNTIPYLSFDMCVSKQNFSIDIVNTGCTNSCLSGKNTSVIVTGSDQECHLGLTDPINESVNTGDDGYLVHVFLDTKKWGYVEGAYTIHLVDQIIITNKSDTPLYYRFMNGVYMASGGTVNQATSYSQAYGTINDGSAHGIVDLGSDYYLNSGGCFTSYNKLYDQTSFNNSHIYNKSTQTLNLDPQYLQKYRNLIDDSNLFDINTILGGGFSSSGGIITTGVSSYSVNGDSVTFTTNSQWRGIYSNYYISVSPNTRYYLSYDIGNQTGFGANIIFYDSNYSVIRRDDIRTSIVVPSNCYYVKILIYNNNIGTYTINNILFSKNDNIDYVPYSLPAFHFSIYYNIGHSGRYDAFRFLFDDTNLVSLDNIYLVGVTDDGKVSEAIDLVNCNRVSGTCSFNNHFHLKVKGEIDLFWYYDHTWRDLYIFNNSDDNIYFTKPFVYNMYDVSESFNENPYYTYPYTYVCPSDDGYFYYSHDKSVVYDPHNPPSYNNLSYFFKYDDYNPQGISGIITAPLSFINSWDDQCSPVLLSVFNTNVSLPCGDTIFWNRADVATFRVTWNVLFGGSIVYNLLIYLFKVINKLRKADNSDVEVY